MRNKQAGFAILLELVFALAILSVMLSMAVVPIMKLRATQNTQDAKARLRQVSNAAATVAMCNIPANACSSAAVAALVPTPGSIVSQGFTYQFTQVDANTWQMTATPVALGFTGVMGIYIDSTSVMRCNPAGAATASSGTCQ